MTDVTSREIMEAAGIASMATLIRWHRKEKLIPPPDIRTHPNGRGKIAYWPEWVLERCLRIRQLRRAGRTLAEIRALLGTDWKAAEFRSRRKYTFAWAMRAGEANAARENLIDTVESVLNLWGNQIREQLSRTSVPLLPVNILDDAITLLGEGINPVLVISGERVFLTADFAVGLHLSACRSADESILVIPVWKELSAYLKKITDLPEQPHIEPVPAVLESGSATDSQRMVALLEEWQFQVESPGQPDDESAESV